MAWADQGEGMKRLIASSRRRPGAPPSRPCLVAGVAGDQLGLEDHLAVAVRTALAGLLDKELGGGAAELVAGLAHRRQRDRGRGGEVDVVVAHDRQVAGYAQLASGHLLEHAKGDQIVGAERRGRAAAGRHGGDPRARRESRREVERRGLDHGQRGRRQSGLQQRVLGRSEEHTSELQSQFHLVCRLLLEKKKTKKIKTLPLKKKKKKTKK